MNTKNFFDLQHPTIQFHLVRILKYGENPHQEKAGLYALKNDDPLALQNFKIVYGAGDGLINNIDFNRAIETVITVCAAFDANEVEVPKVALAVKHGNACGAGCASEKSLLAIERMLVGDLDAILGGVVVCNFHIDEKELKNIFQLYTKNNSGWRMLAGLTCTSISNEALSLLKEKESKCCVITNEFFDYKKLGEENYDNGGILIRFLTRGTVLAQESPKFIPRFMMDDTCNITGTLPSQNELEDLMLAWGICTNSNSNTITIVRHKTLLGNGVGQQSRVRGANLAVRNAKEGLTRSGSPTSLSGSTAWSDSFFPFVDGIKALADEGIKVVAGTIGSKNDEKVINFCKENNVTFVYYPDKVARAFSNH